MRGRMLVGLTTAALMVLCGGMALAGVPCPSLSTLEAAGDGSCAPDAAICPAGDLDDITVTIVVRDCYGAPLPGYMVTVEPGGPAKGLCICPGEDMKTVGPTDATGTTYAHYSKFGGCGQIWFFGEVNSVVIGPSAPIMLASPDIDGDCRVNLVDFAGFALSYLTGDPCCDYDCDGVATLIDFGTFAQHYLHDCGPR
jgi:hypothetical protein